MEARKYLLERIKFLTSKMKDATKQMKKNKTTQTWSYWHSERSQMNAQRYELIRAFKAIDKETKFHGLST